MIRRTLVITVFTVVAMACAAAPALAYGPYLANTVDPGARLVQGASGTTVMWAASGSGSTETLQLLRYSLDGASHGPVAVVSGIGDLGSWCATGQGLLVTVVWKDGSSVFVRQVDLEWGSRIRRHAIHRRDSRPGGASPPTAAAAPHLARLCPHPRRPRHSQPRLPDRRAPGDDRCGRFHHQRHDRIARRRLDRPRLRSARPTRPPRIGRSALRRQADADWSSPVSVYSPLRPVRGHAEAHRDRRVRAVWRDRRLAGGRPGSGCSATHPAV